MSEDSRTKILTRHMKGLDSKLFARRDDATGGINVYRQHHVIDSFEHDGNKYFYTRSSPMFILALTDTWTIKGRPVEWGIEPLMHRLQEIDSWNRGRTIDDLIASYEKKDAARARDRMNQHEAWAYDKRSVFKKAFNDINTSNLPNVDRRQEREI